MSRAAISLGIALFISIGLSGCAPRLEKKPAPVTDIHASVRAFFDSYVEALNRSDSTGVLAAYAPDSQATLAGREAFFRGRHAITSTTGMTALSQGQNTYSIDTLEVVPIESEHALALIVYTVEPSDQDIPAFHTTSTYVVQRSGEKWRIVHVHSCSAREQ